MLVTWAAIMAGTPVRSGISRGSGILGLNITRNIFIMMQLISATPTVRLSLIASIVSKVSYPCLWVLIFIGLCMCALAVVVRSGGVHPVHCGSGCHATVKHDMAA